MKIISVVGDRGSGKTMTSIDLANEFSRQGLKGGVVFEGPEYYARSMGSLLIYPARAFFPYKLGFRESRYDYIIYDGYFHPKSNEKYDLSPIITEETYKNLTDI